MKPQVPASASTSASIETSPSENDSLLSIPAAKPSPQPLSEGPARAQRFGLTSFLEDTQDTKSGTLPISVLIGTAIGVVCGVVAFVYYTVLEFLLRLLWRTIPDALLVDNPSFPPALYWTWIPCMGMLASVGVGLSVKYLGDPGDLASTVGDVHKDGYVHISHAVPMVFASQFSILGGGSLGPEAPLVAICAGIGGWLSQCVFGQKYKNVIRKHTVRVVLRTFTHPAALFPCFHQYYYY